MPRHSAHVLQPHPHTRLAAWLSAAIQSAGTAALYFMGAKTGLAYAVVGGVVSLVWPPSGIALVAVVCFGYRLTPGIALGSLLANLSSGMPLAVAAGMATGATLAAVAGALLLERRAAFHPALDRRRDVVALILLAALLSTSISALIGVTSLLVGGVIAPVDYVATALKWWLGDMMGVLVLAPPLLVALKHRPPITSPARALEALALGAAVAGIGILIFGAEELAGHGYFPSALAIFPFLIWAALRFDHWGASMTTLFVAAIAVSGTTAGTGPFAAASPVDSLIRWCAFVNVFAVTGLLLAASHTEAQRAMAALLESRSELEHRVLERTAELQRINSDLRTEMAGRRRLERKLIELGEEQRKAIGSELHDGLGQHLTSVGLHAATLQQRLQTSGREEADAARRLNELIREAIAMTRGIAHGLYPVALESHGLKAALNELAENTRKLHQVECELSVSPEAALEDAVIAINLYRVAQEALNNALKYGQAKRLKIELTTRDGLQRLSISDDGISIDPERIRLSTGLGLHSLRQRATLLDGSFSIERNALGGTTVAVSYRTPETRPA